MHLQERASLTPDKPAIIYGETGECVSFAELDRRSNRVAQLFRHLDCGPGTHIAVFLENHRDFLPLIWGADRSGLVYTLVPSRLTGPEASYIVDDCDARIVITSAALAPVLVPEQANMPKARIFVIDGDLPPFGDWAALLETMPAGPIPDQCQGRDMLYSSGTTGRPKGIVARGAVTSTLSEPTRGEKLWRDTFGASGEIVYMSPAPLYHAAAIRHALAIHRLGGTVIQVARFDAEAMLSLIGRYRVTHSQWVPTHFSRMLKLPAEVRARYDVGSLRCAVHAAAPCPVPLKYAMMDWWGPILHEYYSGSEGSGLTALGPQEWLAHPGSVGTAKFGKVRICGFDGEEELAAGETGLVYFSDVAAFEYHKDPGKTAESRNSQGWVTLGDIGHVDDDGYLYLTDRKSFMIISGGVNVYPQEVENMLLEHPLVDDVAVIGTPDEDLGEKVTAVIVPSRWEDAGEALAAELTDFVRGRLSPVKRPKAIHFRRELPREPTGKLMKRLLRSEY
ncbi:AMP-binding protein [Sphingobium sp.]|uniref:AMP-binding protein n=1 Tax=Sphingobium sp. TaxID=1912891 RepID=UPI0028BF0CD3|nr:AMP-binding protein [Sphingobium sp.]